LHKLVSPWRLGNLAFEHDAPPTPCRIHAPAPSTSPFPVGATARQIAPQIAAALLAKPRPELTASQAKIVDGLKANCPGYTVMRSLMLAFRSVLRQPAQRLHRAADPNRRGTAPLARSC
jgi:hypothetical protein